MSAIAREAMSLPPWSSPAATHGNLPFGGGAWRHAWVKAQAHAWFHETAASTASASAGTAKSFASTAAGPAGTRLAVAGTESRSGDGLVLQRGAAAARGGARERSTIEPGGEGDAKRCDSAPSSPEACVTAPLEQPSRGHPGPRQAATRVSVQQPAPGDEPGPTAPRLHVEHGSDGLTVWLGLDGNPVLVAAQAAALCTELRRSLAATQQRLAALVCNGQAIYSSTASPRKEAAWP
jgi:hypothetical protein